jgi:hypothetical protein
MHSARVGLRSAIRRPVVSLLGWGLYLFASRTTSRGIFVIPQANEGGVPQMRVGRPLGKLDLSNNLEDAVPCRLGRTSPLGFVQEGLFGCRE